MDEGHIWVGSIIQTNRKQNANNREDFEQQVRLSLCQCGDAQTSNWVQTKETGIATRDPTLASSTNEKLLVY